MICEFRHVFTYVQWPNTGLDDRGDSSTTGGTTTEHGGVSNDLVDALAGLVRHMRALEQSRRRAEQCFADYAAHSIKIILSEAKYDKASLVAQCMYTVYVTVYW